MNFKNTPDFQEIPLRYVEFASKFIAFLVCVVLVLGAAVITFSAFMALLSNNVDIAVQDGLFVLILLEMFYVTRSFIRFGTINVSIVIGVGLIAAVKEMVFKLNNMDMQLAIGFSILFLSLALTYYIEKLYYKQIIQTGAKVV